MKAKRFTKNRLRNAIFGCLFGVIGIFAGLLGTTVTAEPVYAEPTEVVQAAEIEGEDIDAVTNAATNATNNSGESCQDSLGAIGWLVCPTTGKISEAVDWLYDKIETILVINPVKMEDGSPIYEIWKYMLGVTNIVFIIFLLVVVYSQLTGYGISNYGVKKALPKLIVAAILVNLSFVICSLAVDLSNVIGDSLRGLFTSIEESTMGSINITGGMKMSEMYSALAGGSALAIGAGMVAFEMGAIWMLIPTVLGAIVSVVIGLVTIAMRQAVVALLIMISPLAIVAYMLPNTEQWFKKWKDLLVKMLIFYPMFSLLFGASSLAGWAIIASATDGFGVILGVAVQIFPLFFAWSLMKMSGTFLSTINSKLTSLTARPLAANRSWAESHRDATRAKKLATGKVYTPSQRLAQYLSDRKIAREEETREHSETIKNRGLTYAARKNYEKGNVYGVLSREGEESYEAQARNARYQQVILRHKNNMNKGFGHLAKEGTEKKKRLDALDNATVKSFDMLKMEQARSENIELNNAASFRNRMEAAMDAHMDKIHWDDKDKDGRLMYKRHFESQVSPEFTAAMDRYNTTYKIMDGAEDITNPQYAAAYASHIYDTQAKINMTKMQKYFDLTAPTRDLDLRLSEFTKKKDADRNIDAIVSGLRVLSMRGDTDIIRERIDDVLKGVVDENMTDEEIANAIKNNNEGLGVHLGTHASQSIASFLMFDVGDKDPWLKRLGKYINLETAHVYNKNVRKNSRITLDEYLRGQYEEYNPDTGEIELKDPSRPITVLMEGTSLDNVERTAYRNFDEMLMNAYRRKNGTVDTKAYLKRREQIETAIGPQFISASLKYLSGSEQLKSAVDFLTGYNKGKERWYYDANDSKNCGELASTKEDADFAEAYFRRKTEQYFKDQTPTQLLGLRTDYRAPVIRHLMESLFNENPELRSEYESEVSDIQTRYGDLPPDEAAEKRAEDIKSLKMKYTGDRLRNILDKSGKLEQIYRTRRSGAANNAKDWLRDWLLLNDESEIIRYLDQKQQDRNFEKTGKRTPELGNDQNGDGDNGRKSLYKQSDRVYLGTELSKIRDKDIDGEEFYEETHSFLERELGANQLIVKKYEEFKSEVGENVDKNTLADELERLLGDSENYS